MPENFDNNNGKKNVEKKVVNLDDYRKKPEKKEDKRPLGRGLGDTNPDDDTVYPPSVGRVPSENIDSRGLSDYAEPTESAPVPEVEKSLIVDNEFVPYKHPPTGPAPENLIELEKPSSSLEHIIKNLKASVQDGVISREAALGFASEDDFLLKVMTTRLGLTNALRSRERIKPADERLLESLASCLFILSDALTALQSETVERPQSLVDRVKELVSSIVTTGSRRQIRKAKSQVELLYRAIEEYENAHLDR